MLIDYIPVEKLPRILVWIDWNFYAYWKSFVVLSAVFICHYWQTSSQHSLSGLGLSVFVAFCSWSVWCAINYGYAVG